MLYYCQRGDVEKASHILETMRTKNLPLNAAVLDALVLGNVRQGNMEGVDSVLKAMSSAGLNPTSHTYAIIMGGYAKKGDIENVQKILEDTANKEIYFSDKVSSYSNIQAYTLYAMQIYNKFVIFMFIMFQDLMEVIEELADGGHGEHVSVMLTQMQRSPGYNQEAINLIYKLINKAHYDIAIQILESMTKSTFVTENSMIPSFQGSFFIKHLFKTNTANDVVVSICEKLQCNNIAPKAVQIAANIAIQKGDFDLSIILFKTLKKMKEPIRLHYFWPLLVSCDVKITLEILRCMVDEFDLNPNLETVKDYVLPKMKSDDPLKWIELLRDNGISSMIAVRSVLHNLLQENRFLEASQVVSTYGSKTDLKFLSQNLVNAFINKPDVDSLMNILNITCSEEITAKSNQNENADIIKEIKLEQRDVLGNILAFLMQKNSTVINEKIPMILEGYLSNNLGISNESVENIKSKCGNISNEINELLIKLSNNDLNPEGYSNVTVPPVRRSPQQLENLINSIESKGENPIRLRKQLLMAYCRIKDADNVEKFMSTCEENKFVLTSGTLSVIFDMYTQLGNIEKASGLIEKIRSTEPDFVIDDLKVLFYFLNI